MHYDDLGPQQVLDALQAVGLAGDGRVLQLNSYENRVFQVFLEDGTAVVAKFYRPQRWSDAQILEEHAFAAELARAEVPVLAPLVLQQDTRADVPAAVLIGEPPTLARWPAGQGRHRLAVTPRCAGREPELDDPEVLRQLGRFLGRLHAVGRQHAFRHRVHLDLPLLGRQAIAQVQDSGLLTPGEAPLWLAAAEAALQAAQARWQAVHEAHLAHTGQPLPHLRLHGDCHRGNVLWRDGGLHLVDLDDALQGPAVQDLWMLFSGDPATQPAAWAALLEGYEQFSDFHDLERGLIEPLRTLRMLRHSAWLAARWQDPSFPLHFPFFASAAYWRDQAGQLREQAEGLQAS